MIKKDLVILSFMLRLEGIVELRGKVIVLENLENPVLKRILHSRLRKDKFNFLHGDEGYTEHKTDKKSHSDHTERHNDNYREAHHDRHKDHWQKSYSDGLDGELYHTESGYSESIDYGYSEHTDC
jgi:hypothetical protein